jgi:hypothetical protein
MPDTRVKFHFLGSESRIGDSQLPRYFGQAIFLAEEEAVNAIAGRCALVDAESFDAIGFTQDELHRFRTAASHEHAPAAFQAKKLAAVAAAHELRQRVLGGEGLRIAEKET